MKKIFLFICLIFITVQSMSQAAPNWMRYSSISPDGKTIVFTYKGDLYRVSSGGGAATPLTLHDAHDYMPVWSPDSKYIAFASDRLGNFDIYIIPASGGEAKRLTYHSAGEFPYTFSSDGKSILFGASRIDIASNRTHPNGAQPELYKISVNGGRVEQVLSTPAEEVKISRNGQMIIYQDKKGGGECLAEASYLINRTRYMDI